MFELYQSGLLLDISINKYGDIAIVTSLDKNIYKFTHQTKNWTKIPNPTNLMWNRTSISSTDELWATVWNQIVNNCYRYNNISSSWDITLGHCFDISATPNMIHAISYYQYYSNTGIKAVSNLYWDLRLENIGKYMEVTSNLDVFFVGLNNSVIYYKNSTGQIIELSQQNYIDGDIMISNGGAVLRFDLNTLQIFILNSLSPYNWSHINCDKNVIFDVTPYNNDQETSDFILCLYILKLFF